MKFFTLDYYHSDEESYQRSVARRYQQHLEEIQNHLSNPVMELARMHVEFHDALLARVHRDYTAHELTITLRCGYIQVGYFDLKITYRDAEISPSHERSLEEIARTTKNDTRFKMRSWTHEIDTSDDGRIVHRLFFDSLCPPPEPLPLWIEISCCDLHWQKILRSNREIPRMRERFTREGVAPEAETSPLVQCLLDMPVGAS